MAPGLSRKRACSGRGKASDQVAITGRLPIARPSANFKLEERRFLVAAVASWIAGLETTVVLLINFPNATIPIRQGPKATPPTSALNPRPATRSFEFP
jgi:hypothetical protein